MVNVLDWIVNFLTFLWEEPVFAKTLLGIMLAIKLCCLLYLGYARVTGNVPNHGQSLLYGLLEGLLGGHNGWRSADNGVSYHWKPAEKIPNTYMEEGVKPVEVKVTWTRTTRISGRLVGGKILMGGKDITAKLVPWHRAAILNKARKVRRALLREADAAEISGLLAGRTI